MTAPLALIVALELLEEPRELRGIEVGEPTRERGRICDSRNGARNDRRSLAIVAPHSANAEIDDRR